jgi:hypothetical protein
VREGGTPVISATLERKAGTKVESPLLEFLLWKLIELYTSFVYS